MGIVAETITNVNAQRPNVPSVQKYGSVIAEEGFIQYPNLVDEYLTTLNLCSTAIRLVLILISYRRQPEQEIFPSVETLRKRLNLKSTRRVNQITAQLVELGLLIKIERFAERSQISNIYDLEPLFRKVAAWHSAEVAAAMAEEESQADAPFEPVNVIEQAAQIISEEFGEPAPRQQRYNAQRLARRWEQHQPIEWDAFTKVVERAAGQTEKRAKEQTRTGKAFTKLVPYFFSALDYQLKKTPPAVRQAQAQTTQSPTSSKQTSRQDQAGQQSKGPRQPAPKSGTLAERAAARRAAEAAGQTKARAPETLRVCIEAAALTFRDKAVKSSVQRAANLMADAKIDEARMCEFVDAARAATSKACNVKNRMPYFFSILEKSLGNCTEGKI